MTTPNLHPGQYWRVRVKGGIIESSVLIRQIVGPEVLLSEHWALKTKWRRIEDLEFLHQESAKEFYDHNVPLIDEMP